MNEYIKIARTTTLISSQNNICSLTTTQNVNLLPEQKEITKAIKLILIADIESNNDNNNDNKSNKKDTLREILSASY